jgi:hypothetical protein
MQIWALSAFFGALLNLEVDVDWAKAMVFGSVQRRCAT